MARYRGPVTKISRRIGTPLDLKGSKARAMEKKPYPPGSQGKKQKKLSEYGIQLREKQKVRYIYGVLERQFRNYFEKASRQKGITGDNLLRLLERRLDNTVYRLGLARSRRQARQMVGHGHVRINGKKATIPSMLVNVGDQISLREKSKDLYLVKINLEEGKHVTVPSWLEFNSETRVGRVLQLPNRDDIEMPIQEQMIVELYSK